MVTMALVAIAVGALVAAWRVHSWLQGPELLPLFLLLVLVPVAVVHHLFGGRWLVGGALVLWLLSFPAERLADGLGRLRGPRDERGITTLEVVLLVPVFFACIFLAVAAGRLGQARGDIDAVARDAARAGSIARSADEAAAAAQATANDVLADRGLTCADLAVAVDTSDYRAGGWVRVDVSCTIPLTELTGVWTPGAKTMQARGLAVVDTYRRAA